MIHFYPLQKLAKYVNIERIEVRIMCVGIPAKIIECDEISAIVDISGSQREISLLTLDAQAAAGDWVMVHAGFAVTVLDPAEAEETLQMMLDMANE
ncbi:MAG: HypC/HybG/HupF family hydrogenase formation chaperone [Deferribacteraceae bacterium]|jgi:hydrogenase expression/formation protein HypC|nr:HypC/HybG/HupF family hydrogenase formation chaperone [Deferribacteraceae bacterium]